MSSWTPRNTTPVYPEPPYYWPSGSQGECTWYAYYRVVEGFDMDEPYDFPCWRNAQQQEGFNDAKYWLDFVRSPWEAHPANENYQCVAGDIAVFTGAAGHVAVVESIIDSTRVVVSDYNLVAHHTWGSRTWVVGQAMSGYISTGAFIGFLHYPNGSPPPPPPHLDSSLIATLYSIINRRKKKQNVKVY